MRQLITVNLNQFVRFQLTAVGETKTKELLQKEIETYNLPTDASRTLVPDVDGFYTLPVWEFMRFYGDSLYNGCLPLFPDNNFKLIVE